ncbi:cytochrome c3 family protein [Pseudaestuariivita atlantica]|nr:cytochrome c3 family protein [Pseudaestuariivita atlantica]
MIGRLTGFLLGLSLAGAASADAFDESRAKLAAEDIHVTTGAAAGYVPDETCELCHEGIAASYAEVGMARAFHKPRRSRVIEDLEAIPFVHEATGHRYTMRWQDGTYLFSRWREAADGTELDRFDAPVDWVMGSGNHSRVYLIQEPSGKLLQLPLAWYSQSGTWAMPPGFEDANHAGLARPVQRNCMTCHNAYAEVPETADRAGYPNVFPTALPEGLGCQRCHGPGADHVRLALVDKAPIAETIAAIVDPADLPRDRARDVCYACHLQPGVTIQGQVRHGQGFYSFRPGDTLTDHFLNMDFQDGDREKADRFDINHHPYRLEQSACFIESEGELGCTTCHNPHRKIAVEDRAEYYRTKCLSCHETDTEGLPVMASAEPHPAVAADADCTTCHMPERRTEDVIEVTMTDHLVTRDPGPLEALVARLPKHAPQVVNVDLHDALPGMEQNTRMQYILSSILTYDGARQTGAATTLANLIRSEKTTAYEPWLLALKSLVKQKRYRDAAAIADEVLARAPDVPDVIANVGLVRYAAGRKAEGKRMLADLARTHPEMTTPLMNLASILRQEQQLGDARTILNQVLAQEPTNWRAWAMLGLIERTVGNEGAAIEAYFASLRIEPRAKGNRAALADLLDRVGRAGEARLYRE